MFKNYTIYGERCSGTNYLKNIIDTNFDIEFTQKFGFKHFFGFSDLTNTDDILFIGIVRNPYDYLNSLYFDQHHLHKDFLDEDYFLDN